MLIRHPGDYVAVCYMSVLEVDVGIICACMPALRLLLRRVAPSLFGSTIDQSAYLHPNTASRVRTFRSEGARRSMAPHSITKTITTTISEMPKDSDSTLELVENSKNDSDKGEAFATMSTPEHGTKPRGW